MTVLFVLGGTASYSELVGVEEPAESIRGRSSSGGVRKSQGKRNEVIKSAMPVRLEKAEMEVLEQEVNTC